MHIFSNYKLPEQLLYYLRNDSDVKGDVEYRLRQIHALTIAQHIMQFIEVEHKTVLPFEETEVRLFVLTENQAEQILDQIAQLKISDNVELDSKVDILLLFIKNILTSKTKES